MWLGMSNAFSLDNNNDLMSARAKALLKTNCSLCSLTTRNVAETTLAQGPTT